MTSYLYFCSQCVYVPHPFYIPSALNSHLFHLFYFVPALVSSSFAIFFHFLVRLRSICLHGLFCAEYFQLFSLLNIISVVLKLWLALLPLFVSQMNIYLLHTFGCGFKNTPKSSAMLFNRFCWLFFLRFSRALIALLSNCTELNTRKILIYILLLSLIFSHFPVSFFRFFSFVTNESCFLFKMWRAKKNSLSHSHNFSHGFILVLFLSHCTNDTKCFATTIATV